MRHLTLATLAPLAVAVAATAAPAFAQSVDELTVYARGRNAEAQAISETVSFADLDLAYASDRAILRQRINFAAREVCDQLNEPGPSAANLGRSCQDVAVREAMGQVRYAVADARERVAYNGY